jgi:hypothetical protein
VPHVAELIDKSVDETSGKIVYTDKGLQRFRDLRTWELDRLALAQSLPSYPTGEDVLDAYWRTLIANSMGGSDLSGQGRGEVPPAEWRGRWMAWHKVIYNVSDLLDGTLAVPPLPPAYRRALILGLHFLTFYYWVYPVSRSLSSSSWMIFLGEAALRVSAVHSIARPLLGSLISRVANRLFRVIVALVFKTITTDISDFERYMNVPYGRKFCITDNGYMGWVPFSAEPGNLLCAFPGCRLVFAACESETAYRLLGDAYIHGMMNGKAYESHEDLPYIEFQ